MRARPKPSLLAPLFLLLAVSAAYADDAKPYYLGASVKVEGLDAARLFLPLVRSAEKAPLSDARVAAFLGLPAGFKAPVARPDTLDHATSRAVVDYINASPEAVDSAKLRFRARALAAAVTAKAGPRDLAAYHAAHRLDPIAVIINPDCSKGMSATSRPLILAPAGGAPQTLVSWVNVKNSGRRGPVDLTLPGRIANDTLDLAFLHENSHGIMYDLYGGRFAQIPRPSDNGHDGPVISDRGLAWVEGWAEAFEALYGPANPLLKAGRIDPAAYGLAEFQLTRQDPVRREAYIWDADVPKRSGILKTGAQLIATEGVVAAVVYDLLTSRAIADPFGKLCVTMVSRHPMDVIELVRGFMSAYPADARTAARIFLENTRYATASNEARGLYHAYYQAKKAYVQKRIDAQAFAAARDAYVRHKEAVFARVMADPALLSANVGPDLWVTFPRKPAPAGKAAAGCACAECRSAAAAAAGAPAPPEKGIPVNLNTAKPAFLGRVGFTPEQAAEFAAARSAAGFFTEAAARDLLARYRIPYQPLK